MELVYAWLRAVGYPQGGIDWLRQHRGPTIMVLALLAWIPVIVLGWLVQLLFSGL